MTQIERQKIAQASVFNFVSVLILSACGGGSGALGRYDTEPDPAPAAVPASFPNNTPNNATINENVSFSQSFAATPDQTDDAVTYAILGTDSSL